METFLIDGPKHVMRGTKGKVHIVLVGILHSSNRSLFLIHFSLAFRGCSLKTSAQNVFKFCMDFCTIKQFSACVYLSVPSYRLQFRIYGAEIFYGCPEPLGIVCTLKIKYSPGGSCKGTHVAV